MHTYKAARQLIAVLFFAILASLSLSALAEPLMDSEYRAPSPEVTALLTAPTPPEPLMHSGSGQIALLYRESVINLQRLARPRLGLAGFRFDPESQTAGVIPLVYRIEILSTDADAKQKPVVWEPSGGAVLDHLHFSPDGRTLSAVAIAQGPARLVLFDVASGKERQLDTPLSAAWGDPCQWISNNEMLCRVTAESRGAPPAARAAAAVVEHEGGPLPMRTYQNLLENDYEDDLFEYYFTVGLARVERSGAMQRVADIEGLLRFVEPSPDGAYAVVTRLQRPFSRLVPARKFPKSEEVWDLKQGKRLYASRVTGFGIEEDDNEEEEPGNPTWMPGSASATISGGANVLGFTDRSEDAEGNPSYHWMSLAAPFSAKPVEVASSAKRFHRFGWTSAGTPYFATRGDSAEEVSYQVIREGQVKPIWKGVAADRYENPGRALRQNGGDGAVLEVDGRIFIAGDGLSDAGPKPFLDVLDLEQQKVQRVFEAEPGVYEIVLGVLDPKIPSFVTSRETEMESPNLFRHSGQERVALSNVPDPFPQLAGATRQVLTYTRDDGVALSGTLYLPANYKKGEPLPTLVWIYPTEFTGREQAEQMDLRFFRYHKVKGPSPLAAVVAGYAVLLNPTVPIVSEGGEPSDSYMPQLISSVEAAVNYLVDMGVSEPGRLAVAGRSYGAFSSANLLIHTDLFATAIAMSGAYNRTLTPFGFQHEYRSFWEATEYYSSISPFFYTDKLEHPILLVHGGMDENPGTVPFGARRFFHALVGAGAHARYVELPYEGHHYWARENVLLAAAEMLDWLDRFIGSGSQHAATKQAERL